MKTHSRVRLTPINVQSGQYFHLMNASNRLCLPSVLTRRVGGFKWRSDPSAAAPLPGFNIRHRCCHRLGQINRKKLTPQIHLTPIPIREKAIINLPTTSWNHPAIAALLKSQFQLSRAMTFRIFPRAH